MIFQTNEQSNSQRNRSAHSVTPNLFYSKKEVSQTVTYEDDWESDISTDSSITYDRDDRKQGKHEEYSEDTYKRTETSYEFVPIDSNAFSTEVLRQRQAAIDNKDYRKQVNQWQDKTLSAVIKKIRQLSGDSLITRAWIIFYWISQNIQYDIESYFSGNIRHQSTDDVFTTGKAVCDGFGTLFQSMCKQAGIPCQKISGYAKGFGHSVSQTRFSKTNHAWNAIQLGSSWYLIDSTWGEGHIDSDNKNVKKLSPFYFLVPPQDLIYSHFPEDSKWQLLAKPISIDEFIRLPIVYSHFFDYRLAFVESYPTATLEFNTKIGVAEILLQAPENVNFTSSIKSKKSGNRSKNSLAQYDGHRKIWQLLFIPECDGFHELHVYCMKKGEEAEEGHKNKMYECVAELGLNVPSGWRCLKKFPITFGVFGERQCQIFEPLHEPLVKGNKVTIHCRIPGAYCARLLLDDHWDPEVQLEQDILKTEFIVPKSEVTVYAKFQNDNSSHYTGVFRYSIES